MTAGNGSDDRVVKIFDTTLRDGQQCPGAGMSFERNLEYAHLAAELKVDVLEAGFPSASKLDFQIVQRIAEELKDTPDAPVIAGLTQLRSELVDKTIEALLPAASRGKGKMHVYVPCAPDLMTASLGDRAGRKSELVAEVGEFVARAVKAGLFVEFSPEGYSRMGENFDFVTDLIRAAVQSGADTINCPDTIGGACRLQGKEYFVEKLKEHAHIIAREFPGRKIIWSTHCHNDFGLAVDNSIQAVFFGPCRQIEGCINGIGERAGNTALEQCIMIINHFGAEVDPARPFTTRIDTSKLQKVSNFVKNHMLPRQPHWPIVGDNAMKHSSGGHTNAILRNPMAYQPFDPKEVGQEITIVFGPLSGGNHAKALIESAGYLCDDAEKAEIAQFIKDLYKERRKGITDDELLRGYFEFRKPFRIDSYFYQKNATQSEVILGGEVFGEKGEFRESHQGPDSALAALKVFVDKRITGLEIQSHRSQSEGEGISARSLSHIVVRTKTGDLVKGEGSDQDIEISAMRALLDAANRAYIEEHYRK